MNNIGKVCPDCMEKRKAKTQENIVERIKWLLKHEEAFDVKKAFTDENGTEHMWVRSFCIDFKGRRLLGVLNNEPVVVKNIKHGNKVEVKFCDIEQLHVWGEKEHAREAGDILSRVQ